MGFLVDLDADSINKSSVKGMMKVEYITTHSS